VTAVAIVASRRIESPMSDPACVTPVDTFPPPAPTGVAAVAGPGTISLIWDAVAAGDLAGYVVLRADAPDGTLQALTPEPIKDTTYRDTAVTPGTRYAYVVVAVDRSKNRSAASARIEETAR
jgi:fibronectin type 3 domain-containing protein